jgi:hypothetical protein
MFHFVKRSMMGPKQMMPSPFPHEEIDRKKARRKGRARGQ